MALKIALEQVLENNRKDLQKYVCPSCDHLLRDAVQQISCGHWLCECCAKELAGSDPPRCPRQDCLELWNIAEQPVYFPDRFVRKSLKKFSIKCTNDGCGWIGKVEQLTQHLAECECLFKPAELSQEIQKFMTELSDLTSLVEEYMCKPTMEEGVRKEKMYCCLKEMGCRCHQKMTREQLVDHLTEPSKLADHLEIIAKSLKTFKMSGRVEKDEVEKDGVPSNNKALAVTRGAMESSGAAVGSAIPDKMRMVVTDGPEPSDPGMASALNPYSRFSQQDALHFHAEKQGVGYHQYGAVVNYKREIDSIREEMNAKDTEIARLNSKVLQMEKQVQSKSSEGEDRDFRLSLIENSDHDGTMIWKIPQFSQRMEDARSGKYTSIFSLPFYSSRYGYKMCLRLYILGDGIGKNTHMSLFFVVMKGEFDAILQWPFTHKVSFRLINQHHGRDVVDVFQPDPMSSSFQRPKTDMNVASGCPRFISLAELNQGGFMEDNTIFIKVKVDVSTIKAP